MKADSGKKAPAKKAPVEPTASVKAKKAPQPKKAEEDPAPPERETSPEPAEQQSAAPTSASQQAAPTPARPNQPKVVSIGPGGFMRQGPGDQQAPIPPAPPRRLVPAKPSPDIADKTSLLDLNDKICRWPISHPGEADFHFCGEAVNPGFPYCVEHCGRAYQAQLPRGARRSPPPMPFGGPRVR